MASPVAVCLVSCRVHQIIQFGRIRKLDFQHPGFSVWIAVDQFGRGRQVIIDGDYLPGDGCIDIRGGFHRF